MSLSFVTLEKALGALGEALALPRTDITRDAAIQRFEFSFELAWKGLQKRLIADEGVAETIVRLAKRDLFRLAADRGYIDDPTAWFTFLQARNETSHTYDEARAEAVYALLPGFHAAAGSLLGRLNDGPRRV